MAETVFILGAGSSFGDTFFSNDDTPRPNPPLIYQFFDSRYWQGEAEDFTQGRYAHLIRRISNHWGIKDEFGSGKWRALSLEDVFTTFAIENEFAPIGTEEKAYSQLFLSDLKRYIRRAIGYSTAFRMGKFTQLLASELKENDSIITFNYDLLMDQELLRKENGRFQYQNFHVKFLRSSLFEESEALLKGAGLYLKMHGSLNWFGCTNEACPQFGHVQVFTSVGQCLGSSILGVDFKCDRCESPLDAILIPPLLNKPIMREKVFRVIWGNAYSTISRAKNIVVIGFSFPPTDFYAAWLFRAALQRNEEAKIWMVNPSNKASHPLHDSFRERMESIFVNGYNDKYYMFDQLEEILDHLER